jgi:pyruvate dehydrogenase E1 component alpha subunit
LCNTYRYRGHHVGDINREYYRTKIEEQHWTADRDPINILTDWLVAEKHADAVLLDGICSEVKTGIEKAVEFAVSAPFPGPEQAEQDVYA